MTEGTPHDQPPMEHIARWPEDFTVALTPALEKECANIAAERSRKRAEIPAARRALVRLIATAYIVAPPARRHAAQDTSEETRASTCCWCPEWAAGQDHE